MFTESEIGRFESLPDRNSKILIRELWNEKASKYVLSRYILIHWRYLTDIELLLLNPRHNVEISCAAYNNSPFNCQYLGGVGAVLKGDITLAGKADLGTQLIKVQMSQIKVTSAYDRLISGEEGIIPYEVSLANWSLIGIIIDSTAFNQNQEENGIDINSAIDWLRSFSSKKNILFAVY